MLFNSLEFIFVFLPLCILIFYGVAHRLGGKVGLRVLIVASLLFYGASSLYHLLLLLTSVAGNYWMGRRLRRQPGKWFLGFGVALNIGVLTYYKYADFLIGNINFAMGGHFEYWHIILPIGISFYTFQQISYLVDSHKQALHVRSFQEYMLFVTFFPQLIAGPIVRFQELAPQLSYSVFGVFSWENLGCGIVLFTIGLCKKVLLADTLAQEATPIFSLADAGIELSQVEAWSGLLSYSLQIYFDFSAYSDMAIGLGVMLGLRLPWNFLSPYKAENIVEFWRRWHITLSRFLRDYIYIPLGGNRCGDMRQSLNLVFVMLIGGLWHGAHWNFVIWGGMHGVYLMVSHWKSKCVPPSDAKPRGLRQINIIATFLLVSIAWAFFRAETLQGALIVLSGLVAITSESFVYDVVRISLLPLLPYFLIVWFFPNSMELMGKLDACMKSEVKIWRKTAVALGAASGLSICYFFIFSGSYSEFIYFQF